MSTHGADSPLNSTDRPAKGPDDHFERQMWRSGVEMIAGIDEVGRGPLAGPVVAAAVILDRSCDFRVVFPSLNDSKKLTAKARHGLYDKIMSVALSVSIASLSATSIDTSNIRTASLEAMRRALLGLDRKADGVLIDGRDVPPHLPRNVHAQAIVKGDSQSISIAAASIVAKVTRDRMLEEIGALYPAYGLESHKGYGSQKHRNEIARSGGVERLHRYSFSPLRG